MSGRRYFQLLGTGAGDANFGTPDAAQLPARDVRRYATNYLSPGTLVDFNHHTPEALDAYGIDSAAIEFLFISHGHFDHFQPLEIIRFAASLPHPLKVFGNSTVMEALEFCRDSVYDEKSGRFVAHQGSYNLSTTKLAPGDQTAAGEAQVTAVLGNHSMNKPFCIMEEQALNFLVEVGGKTVFYGLDSSYLLPQTLDLLAGIHLDLAILDATFGPRQIDPTVSGHHNWAMLDETLAELRTAGCVDPATVIVADHLSTGSVGPHDQVAAEQERKGIILACDGMTLPL
ncbi:MBL fold metallo-hydrolase [Candidatus Latescibacterota bacterium]